MLDKSKFKWVTVAIILIAGIVLLFFFTRSPKNKNDAVDEGSNPRPEVLKWIEKNYGQDHKKKVALTRLAEADQYILIRPDEAMKIEALESLAMECYGIAFPTNEKKDDLPPYEALAAESFNTYARARKRIAYHGKLSGHVFQMPIIDSWEKQCEVPFTP